MSNPLFQRPRRAGWRNATGWAVALSAAAHLLVALAMLTARAPPEPPPENPHIQVTLYDPPPPPPPPPPPQPQPAPAAQAPADAVPALPSPPARPAPKIRVHVPRSVVAPIPPVHVTPAPVSQPFATLSDGQLVGAVTAGSGGGGSGEGVGGGSGGSGEARCDMVERLQAALRRDADIAAVVEGARRGTGGRALHVWNGDWVQNPGQAGKGLAGLRQAIAMEVAFAPAACRAQPMRGLVLITLGDGAGASRLALGTGAWRWTDLLAARR